MSWFKKAVRRWLNSDNKLEIEDRPYATAHNNMGENFASVQLFKAMNGTILVLHGSQSNQHKTPLGSRQSGPTMYILKDGESVQDAVATLLVKARLDSM